MPKNKDFALRIEIIDECLRNRYRRWTLQDLIDTVSEKLTERYGKTTSKRTIQEDLKYLKEEKQAPIKKRKNGPITYFTYDDANYSIKNLLIEEAEISLLNDAINILRQVNDFKILQDVEEIVNKLKNTVITNVEGSPSIIQFEKHTTALGTEYIDDIFAAIKEKSPLRISYQSFKNDKPEQCVFHPYLLKEYRNRWFVIGRKGESHSITNFALDRIKEIKNSNSEFIANNLFDPGTYFNNLIGVSMPEGQEIQIIEIKVAAIQVPYIRTKPIHYTQEIIKELRNGDILIRISLMCNYELKSVLLSYGSDIEIIKPASLRESIIAIVQEAVKNYK